MGDTLEYYTGSTACNFGGDLMLEYGENSLYPEFTMESYGKINHDVEINHAVILLPPPPPPWSVYELTLAHLPMST